MRTATRRRTYGIGSVMSYGLAQVNSKNSGLLARLGLAVLVLWGLYTWLTKQVRLYNQRLPYAQRWYFLPGSRPWTQITLIDRYKDHNDDTVEIFRFALPHAHEYTGYSPVMSVQLSVHAEGPREPQVKRWFTPISHPEERGVIEFAIKEAEPGRFRSRLRDMRRGDVLFMGRWMKEFQYHPNEHDEVGVLATTGGVSVALQLMKFMEANLSDHTKLTLLYCTQRESAIPLRNVLEGFVQRNPEKFNVEYNVVHSNAAIKYRAPTAIVDPIPKERIHYGLLGYDTLSKVLPPPAHPTTLSQQQHNHEGGRVPNNKLLVVAPESVQAPLCGKVVRVGNVTYFDARLFGLRWHGLLPDLGYSSNETYRFGFSRPPTNLFW